MTGRSSGTAPSQPPATIRLGNRSEVNHVHLSKPQASAHIPSSPRSRQAPTGKSFALPCFFWLKRALFLLRVPFFQLGAQGKPKENHQSCPPPPYFDKPNWVQPLSTRVGVQPRTYVSIYSSMHSCMYVGLPVCLFVCLSASVSVLPLPVPVSLSLSLSLSLSA